MSEPLQASSGLIEVSCEADGHDVYFIGDVDAPVVKSLEGDHDVSGLRVRAVDVGGLTYIDSTGLSLLVRWALEATEAGRLLEIRGATPRFDRVIELAGLTHLFTRT